MFVCFGGSRCGVSSVDNTVASDPDLVAVAIEVPHGPVVDAWQDRGFAVHAINPKQFDHSSVAGAKDDRRDARIAPAGLRTDPHLFRPVQSGDPILIQLRECSRLAAELQQERARLGNRIRQQLWRYYPQLLMLSDDVAAGVGPGAADDGTNPSKSSASVRDDTGTPVQAAPYSQVER
jgi:Transposase